jgi:bifunctional non-homologous end joining protein LigD
MARAKLAEYHKKRDFTKTAEPAGGTDTGADGHGLRFVIQKHAARNLHFDLRLELDGVMKSWAVPKGPSLDPSVKRLAMEVEDHPIEYNTFEGTIPKGEYGGGTVMLWDRGTYTADEVGPDGDEVAALRAGFAAGKVAFTFHGDRLHGSFALVRTRPAGDKPQWLLIKHRDQYASTDTDIVADVTTSVDTGRSMDEIADGAPSRRRKSTAPADAVWHSKPTKGTKAPKAAKVQSPVTPMLASIGTALPGQGWTFEPKYDGVRVIAFGTPTGAALITRNGADKSAQFPEVAAAMRALAARKRRDVVLDGEIVALSNGAPARFQALQNRIHLIGEDDVTAREASEPVALVAFDILADGDAVLIDEPWTERRRVLERRLGDAATGTLRLGETNADGEAMLRRAQEAGWEGIMAKRTDARYLPGTRTKAWLKLKIEERQELVVGGWTDPRESRVALGALLVGYYDKGRLVYAGHVGGGFTQEALKTMKRRLAPLARTTSPFTTTPKSNEPAHWVEPEVVVEVKFSQWTDDGRLRFPIFVGVREDKAAATVTREPESIQDMSRSDKDPDDPPRRATPRSKARAQDENPIVRALREIEESGGDGTLRIGSTSLDVSNLRKVFFPKDGYTKGDLLRYYATVADAILPTMADRPLVLKRFPNGIAGKPFYQQNAPDTVPAGVRVETIEEKTGERVRRFVGGNLAALLYTIQLGAISVDPWMSRVQSLDTPDYTIIDLDPGPKATFQRVVEVARYVKEQLDTLGLHGALKTSGATGMHIYLPLPPHTSEEAARLIAQIVATRVAESHPRVATVERTVAARPPASVYVDYLQNVRGKTVAGVYATRAVDGAHVSTPLTWGELTDDLDPADYTIETVPRRLAERGDVWAQSMKTRNTARALRNLTTTSAR